MMYMRNKFSSNSCCSVGVEKTCNIKYLYYKWLNEFYITACVIVDKLCGFILEPDKCVN